MVLLVRKIIEGYYIVFDELADQRVQSLFLMKNPFPVIGLLALYLMFVLKWGQKFMENRKAFQLNKIIIVYNFIQILLSLHLVILCTRFTYILGDYNIFCEGVNYATDELSVRILNGCHFYFIVKIIDLLDTIFFVLRKKNKQISFLHVYHHAGMVALSWTAVKYFPGGHSIFTGFANSIVHVFMYSYYLITLLNPKYKNNFWWKKYITQMQIVQFFLITLHWISLLFHPECGYPKFPVAFLIPQNFFMLSLFIDFYRKAYSPKRISYKNDINEMNKFNGKTNFWTENLTFL